MTKFASKEMVSNWVKKFGLKGSAFQASAGNFCFEKLPEKIKKVLADKKIN